VFVQGKPSLIFVEVEANAIQLLQPEFTNVSNKLECLSLVNFANLMFIGKASAGVYPRVGHLKSASLGYAPALPANIRLCFAR
jgi:hypothetical protein